MKLTEKCLEDFEKWYPYREDFSLKSFYELKPSMQWGVYVNFFDSVRMLIVDCLYTIRINDEKDWCYQITGGTHSTQEKELAFERFHKSRIKARIAAIEKANEIYNA